MINQQSTKAVEALVNSPKPLSRREANTLYELAQDLDYEAQEELLDKAIQTLWDDDHQDLARFLGEF